MPELPLHERFSQQAAVMHRQPYMEALRNVLATLQEAVQELQAAGFDAALDVRPLAAGRPHKYHAKMHANAILKIDNTAFDLVISNPPMRDELHIEFMTGAQDYKMFFDTADAGKLKDEVIKNLLDLKARNDMVRDFNVAPKMRDDKPRLKLQP